MTNEPRYPLLALARLRMGIDGAGITTLVADTYEMGVRSAELLLERIRSKERGPARCIELKNVLTERGSTQIR